MKTKRAKKSVTGINPSPTPQQWFCDAMRQMRSPSMWQARSMIGGLTPRHYSREPVVSGRSNVDLPPGDYEYRFVVDGCWCSDPEAKETAPNPFGDHNAVLRVPRVA